MPVDPSILAALDEERGVAAASGRNYRTLKLERNQSALVRFLPAQLGPRNTWFARIARHWVNKHPILCVRQTSADFGGDPEKPCILCDLEAKYSQSANKEVQDAARKMGAYPKWLTYAFVWEMINERGHRMPASREEMYIPNEYWLARDSFKEISALWAQSCERIKGDYGFLDPGLGYDFTVMRDSRNSYRHSRGDPMSIDETKTPEELFALIDGALARVKLPDTAAPTVEELETAYEKAEDVLAGRRAGSRASASEHDVNHDGDPATRAPSRSDPPPSRSSRAAEPARGAAKAEAPAGARGEAPARREAAPSPARSEPARREPPPARAAAAPPPARRPPAGIDERELDAAVPEGGEASVAETGTEEAPPPLRAAGGTATPARRAPPPPARAAAAAGDRIDDDPEALPGERRDPAPAAPAAGSAAVAPPARSATQSKLSDSMSRRVRNIGSAQL